jgi:hypothetical protein
MLFLILVFLLSMTLILGNLFIDNHTTNTIVAGQAGVELAIFLYVGWDANRLHTCKCFLKFLWLIQTEMDFVERFAQGSLKKIKALTHIKKIHWGGYIEYDYASERPHNWAIIFELETFTPDSMAKFLKGVERLIRGMRVKSALKTTMTVRDDLRDYTAPIREGLNKDEAPKIVRQAMHEHKVYVETAQIKSYGNYMVYYLPYTPSKKEAKMELDLAANNLHEVLKEMGIKHRRLRFSWQIYSIFFSVLTYLTPQVRRATDESI